MNDAEEIRRLVAQEVRGESPDMEAIMQEVYKRFPKLSGYGFEGAFRKEGPRYDESGRLEFFPPDESRNPRPGVPFVEVYDPDYATADAVFGDMLHYLPSVDPEFAKMREDVWASRTPEQQGLTKRAYEYSQNNFGEERPFEDWVERSRKDAFVRGYLANQWPADTYTSEQREMLENMRTYLQSAEKTR